MVLKVARLQRLIDDGGADVLDHQHFSAAGTDVNVDVEFELTAHDADGCDVSANSRYRCGDVHEEIAAVLIDLNVADEGAT